MVTPVTNGLDALDLCDKQHFDVVFLDENMPGMSGLEALTRIKNKIPNLPVVMITKNEAEEIMEEAIGSKISDYLIKPLNPNQILLAVKRILDNKRLVDERANMQYQQEFREISMAISDYLDYEEWAELYKKLISWDLQFSSSSDRSMAEILENQMVEANAHFSRFISENYESWLNESDDRPMLSHELFEQKVVPHLGKDKPVFFIIIDNLRYDQWKVLEPLILEYFNLDSEESYYSILPTTTAYARNSIFSGLMPIDIADKHPDCWVGEDEEGGKNNFEDQLLAYQLERLGLDIRWTYNKVIHVNQGKHVTDSINSLMHNDLNVLVYNFVDMLSHSRTDMAMIKELAPDEPAYRSLTHSWFQHSPLLSALKRISEKPATVVISTDHGTIRVNKPFRIVGDKNTNTNLRYKQGKNLSYEDEGVLVCKNPERLFLPKTNVSTSFVFAMGDQFFAYPNNYNYYVKYYRDTFQHGGVSLEEMIIPVISLSSRYG